MEYLPSADEVRNWNKVPCLRASLMRGLGCGIVLSVVWGGLTRSGRRVVDGMFLGMMAGASVSWLACRRNDRIRREAVQRMMLLQSKAPSMETLSADRAQMAERASEASGADAKT